MEKVWIVLCFFCLWGGRELICCLGVWQGYVGLVLVFVVVIFVGGFVDIVFVGLEEQYLCYVFVGIDVCWQWCGVVEFKGDMVFLFWFQWGYIDDDFVVCVGVFVQVYYQCVVWNVEVFYGVGQCEVVWWNDVFVVDDVYEVVWIEMFWVDNGGIDVGEYFEFV